MPIRISLVALFLWIHTGFAQTDSLEHCGYHLHGQVLLEQSDEPVAFAKVYIQELGKATLTDSAGHYSFGGLCLGKYTIECTHISCQSLETHIHLDEDTDHLMHIHQKELSLDEVVIRTQKGEEKPAQAAQTLSGIELQQSTGLTLGEALQQIPGVSSLQTGASIVKPVIHGLHSNRVLILNNGVRQEGQQWGQEHAPEIDPFIAKKLTVIKGASSVRYGSDAIAGVIRVDPAPLPDSAGIHGEVNLVGHSNGRQGVTSAIVEGNPSALPGLSWRVQGTGKRGGDMKAPSYYLTNTGVREVNFSGALAYQRQRWGVEAFASQFKTEIGILSAAHIGNLTDLISAIESPQPSVIAPFSYAINRPYQDIRHQLLKTGAYLRLDDGNKLSLTLARQYNLRKEYDKHRPRNDSLAALNLPELQFALTSYTGEFLWEHTNHRHYSSESGISGMHQENVFNGRSFIPNFVSINGGIFSIHRYQLRKWQLEGGFRYDYKWINVAYVRQSQTVREDFDFQNVSASLGAIYALAPGLELKAYAGTAWRAPNVSELFSDGVHHGTASVEIGDPTLMPERALNAIATLAYAGRGILQTEISVFHNAISDFIYLRPDPEPTLTIRGAFPTFRYDQVDASLSGVDLVFRLQTLRNLTWIGKASWLHAQNRSENEPLIYMPANRMENTLKWNLATITGLPDAFLSFSSRHVLRQNRFPESLPDYAPPPAGYTLLGIEAGTRIPWGRQNLFVGGTVSNLLNTSYRDYLNRFRYYADEPGRNITLRLQYLF